MLRVRSEEPEDADTYTREQNALARAFPESAVERCEREEEVRAKGAEEDQRREEERVNGGDGCGDAVFYAQTPEEVDASVPCEQPPGIEPERVLQRQVLVLRCLERCRRRRREICGSDHGGSIADLGLRISDIGLRKRFFHSEARISKSDVLLRWCCREVLGDMTDGFLQRGRGDDFEVLSVRPFPEANHEVALRADLAISRFLRSDGSRVEVHANGPVAKALRGFATHFHVPEGGGGCAERGEVPILMHGDAEADVRGAVLPCPSVGADVLFGHGVDACLQRFGDWGFFPIDWRWFTLLAA